MGGLVGWWGVAVDRRNRLPRGSATGGRLERRGRVYRLRRLRSNVFAELARYNRRPCRRLRSRWGRFMRHERQERWSRYDRKKDSKVDGGIRAKLIFGRPIPVRDYCGNGPRWGCPTCATRHATSLTPRRRMSGVHESKGGNLPRGHTLTACLDSPQARPVARSLFGLCVCGVVRRNGTVVGTRRKSLVAPQLLYIAFFLWLPDALIADVISTARIRWS